VGKKVAKMEWAGVWSPRRNNKGKRVECSRDSNEKNNNDMHRGLVSGESRSRETSPRRLTVVDGYQGCQSQSGTPHALKTARRDPSRSLIDLPTAFQQLLTNSVVAIASHPMTSSVQPHRHNQQPQSPSSARTRAVFGPLPGPPTHSPTRKKRPVDAPTATAGRSASKPVASPPGRRKANVGESTDLLVNKRLAKAAASKPACLDLSRSVTRVANESTAAPNTENERLDTAFHSFPPVIIRRMALAVNLKQLWLTNHALTALPAEISELKRLEVLGLGGNALTCLPPELRLLTNLERLYLERNCLQVLAASLELPSSLRDLRLDHNALTVFPMPVTRLRLLNRLGLSHNKLRGELPAQIGRLRNLVELDLDHNALGPALPSEMKLLLRLERLGIEGNGLSPAGVDVVLKSLPSLVYVRVSGNRGGWDGDLGGQSSSENQPHVISDEDQAEDDSDNSRMTAPRRHDGYFQTTCGYREDKSSSITTANGEELDRKISCCGENNNLLTSRSPPPLPGVVPCRALNLGNAELYRGAKGR
jgi:hypothetical protein